METFKNEFGETLIKVEDKSLYNRVKSCIPIRLTSNGESTADIHQTVIDYIAEVIKDGVDDDLPNEYTDKYYILKMYTGENGRGKWENYFSEMLGFVNNMKGKGYNIWMIDWINDCADDVSTIRFGFRINERNHSTL